MEIDYIKHELLNNTESIVELLETYGFHNVRVFPTEIRCSHDTDSNATSVRVKLVEGLPSTDFAKNLKGDVFTIIMNIKKASFYELIQKSKYLLGLGDNIEVKQKPKLFGGIYDSISKRKNNKPQDIKTYSLDILNNFKNGYSKKFLDDGISLQCQKHFNVGYDFNTDRITVPWFSFSGELVGIMGRYNGKIEDTHAKWFPVIPFSKSCTLYGFYDNYQSIVESDVIYIGESEKFVMQTYTMGYKNSVALGGNNISETQIKQLISTHPKEIIFAFDEGLDMSVIISQCMKTRNLCERFNIAVGYICDINYKYLTPNSKQSPSDLGKEVFDNITRDCIIYI